MTIEASPYRQPEELRAILIPLLCFLPMFGFQLGQSAWSIVPMLGILAVVLYVQIRPMVGNGIFARLKRLHQELPWFEGRVVTFHADAARPDLPQILGRHGFELLELDGRQLRSWHDLAEALTARFGGERFPSDPRQKVLKILLKISRKRAYATAIRWNHADATAAAAPGLLADFAASYAFASVPFLIPLAVASSPASATPAGSAAEHAPVRRYAATEPEPATAALAEAPAGAWWKPQPGELTR
jgi:hypothetical protein